MKRNIINIFLTTFFFGIIAFLIYKRIIYPTIIPMVSNGLLYLFADWSVIIKANVCFKDGIDVYIENPCDPWGRKHVYGQILLNLPLVENFKKLYLFHVPLLINFIFIFVTVNFFNTYKSNKNYFILFFIFSAPFLLAVERANIDILIFLILFIICRYKNLIQNYFLILLSVAIKFYPICFGILFLLKKSIKEILISVSIFLLLVIIFVLFQSDILLKIFDNRVQITGSGIYQFSFKGLIATINEGNIYYNKTELKLVKYFLMIVIFVLPVFGITKFFLKLKNNNIFLVEIFDSNNFENRIYLASSITLLACYFLIQNFFYREIFFLGLIPWLLCNDHKKNSFINFLFYSILIKFIFSTIFVFLVMNNWNVNFNFLFILLKHLMDFYLIFIILLVFFFNLAQYSKKLKSG